MLTTEQLIKIIIGALVVVVVIYSIYLFFRNYVIDFFSGLGGEKPAEMVLALLSK